MYCTLITLLITDKYSLQVYPFFISAYNIIVSIFRLKKMLKLNKIIYYSIMGINIIKLVYFY